MRRELLSRVAAAHGLRVLDDGTRAGLTLDSAADVSAEALPRWRAGGATAVVAAADTMAYGVLAAAHRLGLDVPGDIAVAGFDDLPYSQVTAPALTSVALPPRSSAGPPRSAWPGCSPAPTATASPPACRRAWRPGPAPALIPAPRASACERPASRRSVPERGPDRPEQR